MQEFLNCYSDGVFGVAYLILGIVAIAIFSKELVEVRRDGSYSNALTGLCSFWIVVGVIWMCLGMWKLCEQIDFNSKPENTLKQIEYSKPDCMKFYTVENAPISCLQEYTAWKVRYDKQKNIIDSLRQANIKILNEK
ncbi:MAG: hypothetical protein J6T74_03385 [Clostridia bacterium]|nr:hypothetical protein [Clostridia bacterium]